MGARASLFFASVSVFVAALGVRLLGIRLGLPYIHHWDEWVIVDSAHNMIVNGTDEPQRFMYGAPFIRLVALAARANAHWGFWRHQSPDVELRWVARVISAILSASGSSALLFLGSAVRRPASPMRIGVLAAIAYAFGWELVAHARYGVTDASIVALTAWSMAAGSWYAVRRQLVFGLASIFFAGLAFAFKPPGLTAIVIPVAYLVCFPYFTRRRSAFFDRALLAAAIPLTFAIFAFLNPYYVTKWREALDDVLSAVDIYRTGATYPPSGWHRPGWPHFAFGLNTIAGHLLSNYAGVSYFLSAFALVGVATALRRGNGLVLIPCVYTLANLFTATWSTRLSASRTFLFGGLGMALCVGYGIDAVATWLAKRFGEIGSRWAISAASACVALPMLSLVLPTTINSIRAEFLSKDSRTRAFDWLAEHVQGRATVGISSYVLHGLGNGAEHWLGGGADIEADAARRPVALVDVESCADVARNKPQYVVTTSLRPSGDLSDTYPFAFGGCRGYHRVARFEDNPFECTFHPSCVSWDGRVVSILLERESPERSTAFSERTPRFR
jgi:hypothetical protein